MSDFDRYFDICGEPHPDDLERWGSYYAPQEPEPEQEMPREVAAGMLNALNARAVAVIAAGRDAVAEWYDRIGIMPHDVRTAARIGEEALDENAMLTAELAKHQPEERVCRCGCDPERAMGWVYGVLTADNDVCTDWDGCITSGCPRDNDGDWPQCSTIRRISPTWLYAPDPDWGMDSWGGRHPKFCPECGWRLCSDGVARRNADTALLDALEQLVQSHYVTAQIGCACATCNGGILLTTKDGVNERQFTAPTLRDAIRAALDGPSPAGEETT